MNYYDETKLPVHKRLKLINSIKNMQRIRWRKLKKFHNSFKFTKAEKYFYIQLLITQMRMQKERLKRLTESLKQNN